MTGNVFDSLDHHSLEIAADESSSRTPIRPLEDGYAAAHTATNVRTTVLADLSFRMSGVLVFLIRKHQNSLQRQLERFVAVRRQLTSWLSDPATVELGREQQLERDLRSTDSDGERNLHPRYGLLGPVSVLLIYARMPLYVVLVGFDAPYFFSYFVRAFDGPENPELLEFVTNPAVLAAALISVIPTLLVAVLIEMAAHPLASLLHGKSTEHAKRHAKADIILALAGLAVLSGVLFMIAQSRFSGSPMAANQGGMLVAEILVTALPTLVLIAAVLAHNPRVIEARERASFAKRLRSVQSKAIKTQNYLVGQINRERAAITTLLYRVQARLDTIGAIADRQVSETALKGGYYGPTAASWASNRTLDAGPEAQMVAPRLGVPTTSTAHVERYISPRLRDVIQRFGQLNSETGALRDLTALFDSFHADPSKFLLVSPAGNSDQEEGGSLSSTPAMIRDRIDSLGDFLFTSALAREAQPKGPAAASYHDQAVDEGADGPATLTIETSVPRALNGAEV